MPDFPNTVAIPSTGQYAPALMDFSPLANLPNDYAQGQKNKFDEQQRQRALQMQQPVSANDPKGMALELAKRDPGMAAQLLPFLLGQEPGQVSPLLGGGAPPQAPQGGPQQGAGGPSAQPAATAPAAPVGSPAGSILPGGAQIMGDDPGAGAGADAGTGQIAQMVTGIQPDPQKAAAVATSIAKSVGAGAAPLTPAQQADAAKRLQAYAKRNGLASADPGQGGQGDGAEIPFNRRWAAGAPDGAAAVEPGARILHPQPAQARAPQAPAQPQQQRQPQQGQPQPQAQEPTTPIPGLILPPGFQPGQEVEAVQALRAEGAKALASGNAKTRAQAPELFAMANDIEQKIQPRSANTPMLDPRTGKVLYGGSNMSPKALQDAGERYFETGQFPPNMGRGTQGNADRNAILNMNSELLAEKGLTAEDQTKQWQQYKATGVGLNAGARTSATREENLNLILKAANAAIPAALEASRKVERVGGRWVPINQIVQKGQVMASNPELVEFGMANLQLAEHWARAMNPTGVMRESDRDKALSFLSTATSADTYERAVNQLQKQITRERDAIREQRSGTPAPGETPAAASQNAQTFNSPADVKSAIAAGKLKSGDHFMDADGNRRTVP